MPYYDFECRVCRVIIETNDSASPSCASCGNLMVRIWSAPAVQFKGSGFYSTGG